MRRLFNRMRQEAKRVDATQGRPRKGLISAYDPKTYTARAILQPTGEETGWMPIEALAAPASGIGVFYGPQINNQCSIDYEEDDPNRPKITGFTFSDVDTPQPLDTNGAGVPAGECWIVGAGNNRMTLSADGKTITIKHAEGQITAVLDNTGIITITAPTAIDLNVPIVTLSDDLHVKGDFTVDGTMTAGSFKHTHGTPAGRSDPPDQGTY